MGKLTVDLISRNKSGCTKKKRDETVEQYLSRLTHLYLEGKNIDEIDDGLGLCSNLSVLYLYDNNLRDVPHLSHNKHLTQLYLQNNQIRRISHLECLGHLVKLYLGHNCITVLEGFEKLKSLTELHMGHQILPPGEKLLFDARSLIAITESLQVLDITGNHIDSIRELDCLSNLNSLIARDNELNDVNELILVLQKMPILTRLDFTGNLMCAINKYRNKVILVAANLESLDGKDITKTTRDFVHNWHASRDAIKKRNELLSRSTTMIDYSTLPPRELPPMEGPRNLGGYFMPGLKNRQFDSILAKSATVQNTAVPGHEPIRAASDMISTRRAHRTACYSSRSLARKSFVSIDLDLIVPISHSRYQPTI